jgi:hypothetical protein
VKPGVSWDEWQTGVHNAEELSNEFSSRSGHEADQRADACAKRADELARQGKTGTAIVLALLAIDARIDALSWVVNDK